MWECANVGMCECGNVKIESIPENNYYESFENISATDYPDYIKCISNNFVKKRFLK
jgi:hypothetical protein